MNGRGFPINNELRKLQGVYGRESETLRWTRKKLKLAGDEAGADKIKEAIERNMELWREINQEIRERFPEKIIDL